MEVRVSWGSSLTAVLAAWRVQMCTCVWAFDEQCALRPPVCVPGLILGGASAWAMFEGPAFCAQLYSNCRRWLAEHMLVIAILAVIVGVFSDTSHREADFLLPGNRGWSRVRAMAGYGEFWAYAPAWPLAGTWLNRLDHGFYARGMHGVQNFCGIFRKPLPMYSRAGNIRN